METITTKVYNVLPEAASMIRRTIFMEEQGFENEFDETDNIALHIVLCAEGSPAAVCRFFPGGESEYIIGRIAVLKQYRGRGLGAKVLKAAEETIAERGGRTASLHAQLSARGFYEKQGYTAEGTTELDEGCPHVWMHKCLTTLS